MSMYMCVRVLVHALMTKVYELLTINQSVCDRACVRFLFHGSSVCEFTTQHKELTRAHGRGGAHDGGDVYVCV